MNQKQGCIYAYEKTYHKINRAFYIKVFAVVLAVLCVPFWLEKLTIIALLFGLILIVVFLVYRNSQYARNVALLLKIADDKLDMDFACDIFEELLKHKNHSDYWHILGAYLYTLVQECRFEDFEKIYMQNRVIVREKKFNHYLKSFLNIFYSLQKERANYKRYLIEGLYESIFDNDKEVTGYKLRIKQQKMRKKILLSYELGEYEETLEKLNEFYISDRTDQLFYSSVKERCLYRLGKSYATPDEKQIKYLSGRKWKVLLETGEEYIFDEAERYIAMINQDINY